MRLPIPLVLVAALVCVGGSLSQVSGASLSLDATPLEAPLYQGDIANLSLTVMNTGMSEVEVQSIGVHLDWMPRAFFYRVDLSGQHVRLAEGGSFNCILAFTVPSDLPSGPHYYYSRVQFKELDASGQPGPVQAWTGGNLTIGIHDAYERRFDQLADSVLDKISSAKERHFERSDALVLLARAESEYSLAAERAEAADYRGAVTHLEASSALMDEATEAEESYWRQKASNATLRAEEKLASLGQLESQDARRLVSQAESALSEAQDLSQSKEYKAAISRAEQAEIFAEEALLLETEYQRSKTNLYIIGGSLVTAIACVAFAMTVSVWRRRRAKR